MVGCPPESAERPRVTASIRSPVATPEFAAYASSVVPRRLKEWGPYAPIPSSGSHCHALPPRRCIRGTADRAGPTSRARSSGGDGALQHEDPQVPLRVLRRRHTMHSELRSRLKERGDSARWRAVPKVRWNMQEVGRPCSVDEAEMTARRSRESRVADSEWVEQLTAMASAGGRP